MTSGPQHPPTPRQRVAEARRGQTQRRLIDAARIVLAEQGVESTRIQEITARAGVGFGSFYNYFASKEELVAAVMTATAATLTTALERATEDVADSALAVSIANRFWVRLCWVEPLWARLLVQLDRSEPAIEEMIYPAGRRDLERGRASGRFHLQDVDVALSGVAGGTLEIMRKALDGAVPPEAAEWHAEGILRLLGVPAGEAAQIVRVPLPEIDLEAVASDAPAARPVASPAGPPARGAGADDEADDLELTATFARFEPSGAVDGVMHSHREVRRAILDGRLRPGQEISQLQLAERLGVSRTPLREALRILQNEGLVLAETWRRVRVAPVSADDVVQLYAMRIALESLAVRVSVPQLSASDLDGLAAALDELDRALERRAPDAIEAPHRRFHVGLCARAGARMTGTVGDLWDHAERYRRHYAEGAEDQIAACRAAQAEHRQILAAAQERDTDRCATALAAHLARVARMVAARAGETAALPAIDAAVARATATG